jgi:hypothetical protein
MSKTPEPSCTDQTLVTYHANLRGIAWDANACVNKNKPYQHIRVNTFFWNRKPQGTPQATAKKVDIENEVSIRGFAVLQQISISNW